MNRILLGLIVALSLTGQASLADPTPAAGKARKSLPAQTAGQAATGPKVIPPAPAVGGLTGLPGQSQAQPGTYCCTTGGSCTAHGPLAVCVGPDYIRWECTAENVCTRVPFGGDN